LHIALKYDYGKPERGYGPEYYNYYDTLVHMDGGKHQVIYFPFDEIEAAVGRKGMNKKLLETVEKERPQFCFFCLFADEIYPETIKKITTRGDTVTFNWFSDDHFRFDNFSRYYAPCFNWVSTTDSHAPAKYKKIGYDHAIKTQWACNQFRYQPPQDFFLSLGQERSAKLYKYDVSFVGQAHSNRREIVRALEEAGIKVDCFGSGWPNGRVTQEQMFDIWGRSKINLNLSQTCSAISLRNILRIFIAKQGGKFRPRHPRYWLGEFKSLLERRRPQIKGRVFEIPGCGGFEISEYADNVTDYYVPDKEMAFFAAIPELVEKVKYFLSHDEEREKACLAAYERTLREHTFERHFKEFFKITGVE